MTVLQLLILALVQGVTEFLPISSSGHLVLVPILAGWADQGLVIDVAVHVGTLGAVMLYLWRDIASMIVGLWQSARGRKHPGQRLFWFTVLATVPLVGAGWAVNKYAYLNGGDWPRSLEVIGWATLGFGVLLYLSDMFGLTVRRIAHLRLSDSVIIGLSQILALIPGTSRSGITMTAARFLGMERSDAARFSMILSMPAIMGAGALKGLELYTSADAQLSSAAVLAAGLSFVAALITIALLMAWLKRASFTPFVIYRIALGLFLLWLAYSGAGT